MARIIDINQYRKARRETHYRPRRAPPKPHGDQGLVSIGVVSAELVRRLMETE